MFHSRMSKVRNNPSTLVVPGWKNNFIKRFVLEPVERANFTGVIERPATLPFFLVFPITWVAPGPSFHVIKVHIFRAFAVRPCILQVIEHV